MCTLLRRLLFCATYYIPPSTCNQGDCCLSGTDGRWPRPSVRGHASAFESVKTRVGEAWRTRAERRMKTGVHKFRALLSYSTRCSQVNLLQISISWLIYLSFIRRLVGRGSWNSVGNYLFAFWHTLSGYPICAYIFFRNASKSFLMVAELVKQGKYIVYENFISHACNN